MEKNQKSIVRTGGGNRTMMARTIDLMQITHPGFSLLQQSEIDFDEELPLFMEYCILVVSRFKHYATLNEQTMIVLCLTEVIHSLQQLSETDEPHEVLPLRADLLESVINFRSLCYDMSNCIVNDSPASDFYIRLGEKTFQYCTEYAGVKE